MPKILPVSEGSPVPDFTLRDQDGKPVRLRDYRGKKVALYFYVRDDTPGCTKEACWGKKNMYGKTYYAVIRSTFVIDEDGRIAKAYRRVKVDGHLEQILRDLK